MVRPGGLVLRASLDELSLLERIEGPLLGLLLAPIAGIAGRADLLEQVGLGRGQLDRGRRGLLGGGLLGGGLLRCGSGGLLGRCLRLRRALLSASLLGG